MYFIVIILSAALSFISGQINKLRLISTFSKDNLSYIQLFLTFINWLIERTTSKDGTSKTTHHHLFEMLIVCVPKLISYSLCFQWTRHFILSRYIPLSLYHHSFWCAPYKKQHPFLLIPLFSSAQACYRFVSHWV